MGKKQEAIKSADRLLAYLEENGGTLAAETRRDILIAIAVLRQLAWKSVELRRKLCRRCRNSVCGDCPARWVQGLIGERPGKLNGEARK